MTTERIKEIQKETAYPDSVSVYNALLKVWNECEQEKPNKWDKIAKEALDATNESLKKE